MSFNHDDKRQLVYGYDVGSRQTAMCGGAWELGRG